MCKVPSTPNRPSNLYHGLCRWSVLDGVLGLLNGGLGVPKGSPACELLPGGAHKDAPAPVRVAILHVDLAAGLQSKGFPMGATVCLNLRESESMGPSLLGDVHGFVRIPDKGPC